MNTGQVDPQLVADQFLRVFNVMAQNGHHRLARSLSGLARVTRVDDNLWDAICYNGAHSKRTPLLYACVRNDVERVRFLLPHSGAEQLYHEYPDQGGPLFMAAKHGHPAIVATLCKYITGHKIEGALDFRGPGRRTPLMVAAGRVGWVKALSETRAVERMLGVHSVAVLAALGIPSLDDFTPVLDRFKDVVACLVHHGCDINATDENGNTVLIRAIQHNDSELVSFLCTLGVDVNYRAAIRFPLQEAVQRNSLNIVTILCDHGADNECCTWDCTVLECAKRINRGRWGDWAVGRWTPMVQLLESRFA
jgi:ankyrin repeat protein